jgi:hypothetical protein
MSVKDLTDHCNKKRCKRYSTKKKAEFVDILSFNNHIIDVAPNIEAKTDAKATIPMEVEMTTLPSMDKTERVKKLKEYLTFSKMNHKNQIMKLATLKDAHVYCVIHNLSAQQYGPLLERFIYIKFNYNKNKAKDCIGDCSKNEENFEVKVTLGGATHTKFNFV